MKEVVVDGVRYVPADNPAARVSIYGMYDCHCFEKFEGKTVDKVIENWKMHNRKPTMARIGSADAEPSNIGFCDMTPVVVLDHNEKELRRVGGWIHCRGREGKIDEAEVDAWRNALLADPDIPRLLAEGA